jgi:hypothetical protein
MKKLSLLLCALSLGTVACGDDAPPVTVIKPTDAPVLLDDQLVFVDAAQRTAALLDVSQAHPLAQTRRVEIAPGAIQAQRRNQKDEALILCAGERGDADTDPAPAALVALTGAGKARSYELGTTPFNAIAQSDDGRYAIAYREGPAFGRTLDNPNELIVVNLDLAPEDVGAVTRKAPEGLGHTLDRVLISPTMRIADEDRRLLVLLSAAEVTIFDLTHLDRRATIVQLDETRNIDPQQVVFSTQNPTLYVRAGSSDNIFMFRFEPYKNTDGGNDFQPSINPLSGGVKPSDMALFGSGTAERLLVVAQGSAQALVIDPDSSKTQTVPLKAAAQHIMLFDAASPRDARVQTRALLYSDAQTGLSFLDPESLSAEPSDNVEALTLSAPANSMIPLLAEEQVVLLQANAVSLLNLSDRTLTPITSSGQLSGAQFDAARKRLWVGSTGQVWLGSLDLSSGKTDELRLDSGVDKVLPMLKHDRLVVLHGDPNGSATLVDLEHPDREHIQTLHGYFADAAPGGSAP